MGQAGDWSLCVNTARRIELERLMDESDEDDWWAELEVRDELVEMGVAEWVFEWDGDRGWSEFVVFGKDRLN